MQMDAILSPAPSPPTARTDSEEDAPQRAYADLKARIVTLDLLPGQRLPAQDTADRLGLSRTPVREALQRLAQDGLIERTGGWGFTVCRMSRDDIRDVFELRMVLEPEAARLALERLGTGGVERLGALLDAAEAAGSRDQAGGYLARSRGFHSEIARAAGNRLLASTLLGLNDRIQIIGSALVRRYPDRLAEVTQENRSILEALAARDPAGLDIAVRRHIDRPAALIAADSGWFEALLAGRN